jgi:hypothetical protein
MKTSLVRIIYSILIGIMIFWGISLCLPHKVPGQLSNYLPLVIGAFLAGYIAGKKGWVVGLIVGILNFLIIQVMLSLILTVSSRKLSLPPFPFDVFLLISFIMIGTVLGALGQWVKKRTVFPKTDSGINGRKV